LAVSAAVIGHTPEGRKLILNGSEIPPGSYVSHECAQNLGWRRVDGSVFRMPRSVLIDAGLDAASQSVVVRHSHPDGTPAAVMLQCGVYGTTSIGHAKLPYASLGTGDFTIIASAVDAYAIPATVRVKVIDGIVASFSVVHHTRGMIP
jgi:hypothetical protein